MTVNSLFLAHSHEVYLYGLSRGLRKKNYQISGKVFSGTDALHYILEHHPPLVLLEADLPYLSAFDIIKAVSAKRIKTKFIVIFPDADKEYILTPKNLNIAGNFCQGDSFETISTCLNYVKQQQLVYTV